MKRNDWYLGIGILGFVFSSFQIEIGTFSDNFDGVQLFSIMEDNLWVSFLLIFFLGMIIYNGMQLYKKSKSA